MAHLLRTKFEEKDTYVFQMIDVNILDFEYPSFGYSDNSDITGDNFLELICDLEPKYNDQCDVALIGCTENGNSILVKVKGFMPYLFYKKTCSTQLLQSKLARLLDLRDESELLTKVVTCKNLYGWEPNSMTNPTDRKQNQYVQVFFPNVRIMKKAIKKTQFLRDRAAAGLDSSGAVSDPVFCHEWQITGETKFVDYFDIVPCGWIQVQGKIIDKEERISHCQIELECQTTQLRPLLDKDEIAPLLVAAIDIECISSTGAFPDASHPGDIISMIGAVYWRIGMNKDEAIRCVYVVGDCDDIEGAHVYKYSTEREMLSNFRTSLVANADPDIVATYNGFGFDLEYMWTRAELLGCEDFGYLDRIIVSKCKHEKKELSSSALGSNDLFIISMIGRCNLDIFHWIKAREKLQSYKLDNVCEHFLGERKIEMDYKELFKLAQGTGKDIALVAVYCIKDCWLLIALILRLQIITANVEMSRVCFTPMEALVTRGQQFKVMNQLLHYGHREGRDNYGNGAYVLNTPEQYSGCGDDSYEGATVIDAKADYYTTPIATLDFMSLYPSIILANNFCFSTLVMNPKYSNIPGVTYETIQVTDKKVYIWAKGMTGLIPIMLDKLLAARKKAKKAKANAKNDIEKAVFDGRQLALKISANSIYGFTGAVKMGKYHCLGVADSTTYKAREMLHQTKSWVMELYNCDVVYGDTDSVMVNFKGVTTVEECFALGDEAADKITAMFSEKYNTDKIILEMEKVYHPYLLMRKKRYAGLMYEKQISGVIAISYLDAKGIELVRRDNCQMAKNIQSEVLDALMYKLDKDYACDCVHNHLKNIVDNKLPLDHYKMSKSRRKNYKNEDLPHIAVVKKMEQRNPGSAPQIGDRVPFVLIETKNLKAKTFEKAEDPNYVEENDLKVDRLYYVEHQVVNSICNLLELVIENPQSLFTNYLRQLKLQRTNQSTILEFLKRKSPEEKKENNPKTLEVKEIPSQSSQVQFEESMMSISNHARSLPKKRLKKK